MKTLIALALVCLPVLGQESTPETPRKPEVDGIVASLRDAVARKAIVEKVLAALTIETRLLPSKLAAVKARLRQLETTLGKLRSAHGSKESGTVRVTYDLSEKIAEAEALIPPVRAEIWRLGQQMEKLGCERMSKQSELDGLNDRIREQRIILQSQGVAVEPLLVPPGPPKPELPAAPPAKQIFVTKDGRMISAIRSEKVEDYWMITTPTGKIMELEAAAVEKIIKKSPERKPLNGDPDR